MAQQQLLIAYLRAMRETLGRGHYPCDKPDHLQGVKAFWNDFHPGVPSTQATEEDEEVFNYCECNSDFTCAMWNDFIQVRTAYWTRSGKFIEEERLLLMDIIGILGDEELRQQGFRQLDTIDRIKDIEPEFKEACEGDVVDTPACLRTANYANIIEISDDEDEIFETKVCPPDNIIEERYGTDNKEAELPSLKRAIDEVLEEIMEEGDAPRNGEIPPKKKVKSCFSAQDAKNAILDAMDTDNAFPIELFHFRDGPINHRADNMSYLVFHVISTNTPNFFTYRGVDAQVLMQSRHIKCVNCDQTPTKFNGTVHYHFLLRFWCLETDNYNQKLWKYLNRQVLCPGNCKYCIQCARENKSYEFCPVCQRNSKVISIKYSKHFKHTIAYLINHTREDGAAIKIFN